MAAIPSGYFQTDYRGDLALRARFQRARRVLLYAFLLAVPFLVSSYFLNVAAAIALAVPGAIALSLLTGVAGQISLGNAAFMGLGATTAALAGAQLGLPFLACSRCPASWRGSSGPPWVSRHSGCVACTSSSPRWPCTSSSST